MNITTHPLTLYSVETQIALAGHLLCTDNDKDI